MAGARAPGSAFYKAHTISGKEYGLFPRGLSRSWTVEPRIDGRGGENYGTEVVIWHRFHLEEQASIALVFE